LRRLIYLLVLAGGGGGWFLKDHPRVQAVWTLLTGKPAEVATQDPGAEGELASAVSTLLKPAEKFREPGTYQVTIGQVHLDPSVFTAGHTVDIQAKVLKRDERGRSTTLWETGPYGERLAVAGRDELVAEWEHRPFQVEWRPGEQLAVEVYDRRALLFTQSRRFVWTPPDPQPREFPLKPGTFPLKSETETQKPDPRVDPRNNSIVTASFFKANGSAIFRPQARIGNRLLPVARTKKRSGKPRRGGGQ
jgi:hypothetical protein